MMKRTKNHATLAIPRRWERGSFQITEWCRHYTQTLGVNIDIHLGGQWDICRTN
jgi:hypothetical protein